MPEIFIKYGTFWIVGPTPHGPFESFAAADAARASLANRPPVALTPAPATSAAAPSRERITRRASAPAADNLVTIVTRSALVASVVEAKSKSEIFSDLDLPAPAPPALGLFPVPDKPVAGFLPRVPLSPALRGKTPA